MLIGPDAPIVFDNCRSSFMDHSYDFYKPDPFSEYPTVDGHQSIEVYLNALRQAFNTFKSPSSKMSLYGHKRVSVSDFDYFCFHTPFSKMVQKSFLAMVMEDIKDFDQKYRMSGGYSKSPIYDQELVNELQATNFKLDAKNSKALLKHA